jgi:HAD superfamily hydrolase (TIGR01490 family)
MTAMSITRLALFDLDHTLLPIDSGDSWSHFLANAAGLDAAHHGAQVSDQIRRFTADYRAGRFDVEGYLSFQMGLLARFPRERLELWRTAFLRTQVFPQMRFEAQTLVEKHRGDGYTVAIVTGTHSFVTRPIAALFGVEHLIALQPEEVDGEFTGRYLRPHTFQHGKVQATEAFLASHGTALDALEDSVYYGDSINDLPLLERVKRPVVTHGDAQLRAIAAERGWEKLELFDLVKAA